MTWSHSPLDPQKIQYMTVALEFLCLHRVTSIVAHKGPLPSRLVVEQRVSVEYCVQSFSNSDSSEACHALSLSHQMHAFTCAEKTMITSSRPSLTLEGPRGEFSSHSSMKSGILSRRISLIRRTRRSMRTSLVDLFVRMREKFARYLCPSPRCGHYFCSQGVEMDWFIPSLSSVTIPLDSFENKMHG